MLAERLRKLVEGGPIEHAGQPLPVTISIGVAGLEESGADTLEDLVKAADSALYAAKRAGRNRVERYTR